MTGPITEWNQNGALMRQSTLKRLNSHLFKHVPPLVRVALGAMFLLSATPKVAAPARFLLLVRQFHLFPGATSTFVALAIPYIELIVGICLIAGIFIEGTLLVCSVLFISFVAVAAITMARGLSVACACFSVADDGSKIGVATVVRGVVCLGVVLWLWTENRRSAPKTDLSAGCPASARSLQ
jgi:uncharacterized membrane protein YphA (DoxX/SURF4 family)